MDKQRIEDVVLPTSSDECGHSGDYPDSDEDIVTDYHITNLDILQRADPLPTISIIPHSPVSKVYPVLEDNLQQLRELHENIQHMRYNSIQDSYSFNLKNAVSAWNPLLSSVTRFSNSCPSLNERALDLDVFVSSVGSSPLHQSASRKTGDWSCQPEISRRRSWSAAEDLTLREKTKFYRQRSISLSSMESEADESFIDTVDSGGRGLSETNSSILNHKNPRCSSGATSIHSLNEVDLQEDFGVAKVKREKEQRLLSQRLPLQKSVSTPSILAVRDLATEPLLLGTDSSKVPYEGPSEKRRKRGSLFFRKRKDKNKKNIHQWVSACYGSSNVCDVCNKNMNNKPALYCDYCGVTVHQNSCRVSASECIRNKSAKNNNKTSGGGVLNSKNYHPKRGSTCSEASAYINTSYSPMLYDDRDTDLNHGHAESVNFTDDIPLIPSEFLSDSPLTAKDLSSDFDLGLHENEPDSWTPCVGKEVAKKMKEKEVKRQEHIYEFILTEKHHCITLLVVQKVFVEGLQKYFQMGTNLERMFPRLADLIELHLEFLRRLRRRQKQNSVVSTIADILEEQFSDQNAQKLKSAYGEFCSKHREAVEIYKGYLHGDPRFEQFVRHCQSNPLLKKKGIPECILFITQRLTKYPLLIEPLIKTSKESKAEQETLQRTLNFVKDILVDVDTQVAEKEKEDRKLEIYNKIDAKSCTVYRGVKFKKSDILQGHRTLKFEGSAMLMQGRSKMQLVLVIVLSDVLFFLQENSQKYVFFTPENKAGVISLQKLLVREKAGQDSRGVYLISSNPADPEMFELKVHKPKDKQIWIHAIREAVQTCPEDEESLLHNIEEKNFSASPRHPQIRHLVGLLRQKDVEQALLFEEKMALQLKLLTAFGVDPPSPPTYRHLVSENIDTGYIWKEVLTAVQEVNRLTNSLCASGTNLSRSVSSAGEHQSETYVLPILPKRAETFGGFDSSNQNSTKLKGHSSNGTSVDPPVLEDISDIRTFAKLLKTPDLLCDEDSFKEEHASSNDPAYYPISSEQQYNAVQLSHYIYTLLCIISQLMTTNESFQAQLNTLKGGGEGPKLYRHNQQLEELRNLQDKLSAEKSTWAAIRDQETKDLEDKRAELLKLQEQIKTEEEDIKLQREHLFRTMEKLTNKGIIISPNVATLSLSGQPDENYLKDTAEDGSRGDGSVLISALGNVGISAQTSTAERKKDKWNKNSQIKSQLPINLISATNQQKVPQNVQVKQQIPLKLASRLCSSGVPNSTAGVSTPAQLLPLKLSQDEKNKRTNASGYHRLSPSSGDTAAVNYFHCRTGSSPAIMDETQSDVSQSHQVASCSDVLQKTAGDEEVIYF